MTHYEFHELANIFPMLELAGFYEACVGEKPEKFLKIPYPH